MKTIADALKCKKYCTVLVTGSGRRMFWAQRDKMWIVTQTGIANKTLYIGTEEHVAVRYFLKTIKR